MEKDFYKHLGQRVKTLRVKKHITQEELASFCNVCCRTISNLERGCSMPDFETVYKISKRFDVSLDYLIDFQSNPKKSRSRIETENLLIEQIKITDDSQLYFISDQLNLLFKYFKTGNSNEN